MFRTLMLLLAIVALTSTAHAADTTYRDSRQPSFSLLVPDGWTAERNERGVTLRRDETYFSLLVFGGATSPGAMLVQMRAQFEPQWKHFRELDAGRVSFGGQDGAFAVYGGLPPSGIDSITRIVTMTNGRLTYAAFQGMPAGKAAQRRPELERIERSFAPDPAR